MASRTKTWTGVVPLLIITLTAAWLTGCAGLPPPSASPLATPVQPAQEVTMPKPSPSPAAGTPTMAPIATPAPTMHGVQPAALGTAARQDLATSLQVPIEGIQVISVDKAEMPAGSLGCGDAGGRQNTGLIIGYEITLSAGGQEYIYHSDGLRLVPCSPTDFAAGGQPAAVTGTPAKAGATIQGGAVADLAQRLGIAPDAISVISIEPVEWPDASLGCAKPGMMYAQVVTPGYRIVLEAGGKTYEYHTGGGQVATCP
jgi:hypothetical protein